MGTTPEHGDERARRFESDGKRGAGDRCTRCENLESSQEAGLLLPLSDAHANFVVKDAFEGAFARARQPRPPGPRTSVGRIGAKRIGDA